MAQFKKLEILPKLVDKQVMHFPGPRFEISPRAKKVKFQHLLPLTYLQCAQKVAKNLKNAHSGHAKKVTRHSGRLL